MRVLPSVRRLILGKKLDPFDPKTRRHIVLVALLAWIGLGADGLSSSCYGPEEAFLALGDHTPIALYLAGATALTVFIISLAYNQVIELFPSGGGGYKAATQLIGPYAGLISGSALIVDYVLTIAISVASGADAMFSLLSPSAHEFKLGAELGLIMLLIVLNLRGMKESILVLAPIFLGFFATHVFLIVYGIHYHADSLHLVVESTVRETMTLSKESGWLFTVALFLRAYSVGAGTYTGIEAVSNNINMLAEPRVRTGHLTMFYMALSLAFTAGGIILLYLLWHAVPAHGQTLNAVTFRSILNSLPWSPHAVDVSMWIVLALEAGLLLVAANTGFLGGPAVLASMAADHWVPRQFRQLSSRMVTQNGVLVMGIAALVILLLTRGQVGLLVVLYSINVFLTFSLSLFGLSRHWWEQRLYRLDWKLKFAISGVGFVVCVAILLVILAEKLMLGGWVTVALTSAVVGFCLVIHRHYEYTRKLMQRVDQVYALKPDWDEDVKPIAAKAEAETAIILVGNSRGAGMHALRWVLDTFPERFHNFVFVSVGEVDKDAFNSERTLKSLRARIENSLAYFTSFCSSRGLATASYQVYGGDPFAELMALLPQVFADFPKSTVFASKLVFGHETLLTRWLHNQMPLAVQQRLEAEGHPTHIVPLPVPKPAPPPPQVDIR
ncbi:APC family permease [Solimonas marina]|uniref:APC family permease n=1 Tax=Solimonas marina TaxID=2714601 RepID=A0A969W9G0_9GAMM|nr:APC family permease [Solimonas marina]NKF20805.1 APC family permease [Solimonas marina]